ncbi:MAG: GNAT family N-acetyltransferase [Chloroflexi bacterium]|nr:GNAT family N-acetyltransferase [Chloroflexota bacterium]
MEQVPTLVDYRRLPEAVGWGNGDAEAQATALGHALFSVCLLMGDEVIGCGRVVGDAEQYDDVQDIIVLPSHQGQGLGRRIMDAIMAYLAVHTRPRAFVALMAAQGVAPFYERYGFVIRLPGRPLSQIGSQRVVGRRE